ncbi:polycomb group RING finger protein 3-like [Drosophila suzukii]|uniref:Polycomb group RING finger protein 3-like n=1 Tax=Drosophila suzukii TaxID=28584 RepID=A0ABM4TK90_DROSZ
MSVRHSNENLVSLGDDDSVTCTLCNGVVFELDLMETACKHCFHKACLQNWLQDNNTCPTCSQPCSQSQTVSNQNSGMQNRMMTRSRSRNADNQNNIIVSQNGNSNPHQDNRQTNDSDVSEDPDQQSLANQMRAFQKSMLDNQKTFQVTTTDTITEKMTQMFSQLNRSTFVDNNTQHEFRNNSGQVGFQNNQGQNSQRVGNSPDVRSNRSDLSLDRPDRISNVISNWRIKFSGSADDIAVEDFIYRVLLYLFTGVFIGR